MPRAPHPGRERVLAPPIAAVAAEPPPQNGTGTVIGGQLSSPKGPPATRAFNLICARDLAREFPERAAVLPGVPEAIGKLLAQLSAEELAAYLGERIMDRLLELGSAIVPFTWASHHRGQRDV